MKEFDRHLQLQMRALCADPGPFDGLDPRLTRKEGRDRGARRKALQLCKQVGRTVELALADAADPLLRRLIVVEVRPAESAGHLVVRVTAAGEWPDDPGILLERLERVHGWLRAQVAGSIHRSGCRS